MPQKGYTNQQYIMCFFHQAFVLPLVALTWSLGLLPEGQGPILVYVLTGVHLLGDSILNYTPLALCLAGSDGAPEFTWGVHAHHLFTAVLCAIGTTLPPWPVAEGAVCVLLGETGSLWITWTLLWPTPTNFRIRFYSFLVTRVAGVLIALDIMRQLGSPWKRGVMLAMVVGLCYDNWGTLGPRAAIRTHRLGRRARAGTAAAEHASPLCDAATMYHSRRRFKAGDSKSS